jgi:hypothetical protein
MKLRRVGLAALFLTVALTPAAGGARAADFPLGYPGSTWGSLRYPNAAPEEERENLLAEGALEQGVDWAEVGPRMFLNTFASLRYSVDSEKLDFNNKLEPGVGVKLRLLLGDWAQAEVGVKYVVEYRFESDRRGDTAIIFLNWGGWWDLKRR